MQKRKKILDVCLFLGLLGTYILLNKYFFGIYNIIVHYVHKILCILMRSCSAVLSLK